MAREGLVTRIDGKLKGKLDLCEGCAKGKAHKPPHPSQDPEEKLTHGRVHMVLVGPFKPQSIGGTKYNFELVDYLSDFGGKPSQQPASHEFTSMN